jgi:hypothetical protein
MSKENLKQSVIKAKNLLLQNDEFKSKLSDLVKVESLSDFLKSFKLIYDITKQVVYAVEIVQVEYNLCSKEEKIDVAAELLDDIIDFKGWALFIEPFDGLIFKVIISGAVSALNDKLGKDWLGHVKSVFGDILGFLTKI